MKSGKITQTVFNRSVLKQLSFKTKNKIQGCFPGIDAGCLKINENITLHSAVATVTGEGEYAVKVAVIRALNNLYADKIEPKGISCALTLPTKSSEQKLKNIMKELNLRCKEYQVDLLSGHTTYQEQVLEPVVTITAFGFGNKMAKEKLEPMDTYDILVTGFIGLEGTSLIMKKKQEELSKRFRESFVNTAIRFDQELSIKKEYEALKEKDAFLHDVHEGGIFGALWDVSERFHCGMEIDLTQIPVRQETIEVSEYFDINPYCLLSGGCTIVIARQGMQLAHELSLAGIEATRIGHLTTGNDKLICNEDEIRYLEPLRGDEIYKVI